MRRVRKAWALAAAALLLLAAPAPAQDETEAQVLRLGTGGMTGLYYPVGVALCRLVNQHRRDTGLRCAATPSEGSAANIAALQAGDDAFAIVQSDVQAAAVAGDYPDLRAVMALYPEALTVVARADAGVTRIEDLAGKRVWIGPEGSGTRALAEALIAALGWTAETFEPAPELAPERLGPALCNDEIDVFLYAVGNPALVIQEATTGCDAVLVPASGAAVAAMVEGDPALVAATIPGGLYRGNPDPTETFGVGATLVTDAGVPDVTVHALAGAILDDLAMLRGLEPVLADLDPAAMASDGLSAPLHPGAERAFREHGAPD